LLKRKIQIIQKKIASSGEPNVTADEGS